MTLVIGTDEAGYGPNLGPLVVAATAWQVEAPPEAVERAIAEAVEAATAATGLASPIWGDSKKIFKAGGEGGIRDLESGVMAAVAMLSEPPPDSWSALERLLGPLGPPDDDSPKGEWEGLSILRVPIASRSCESRETAGRIGAALASKGVRLRAIRVACVYPAAFNQQLDRGLNKSDILSRATLALAKTLADSGEGPPIVIWCDRHGGRKRYAGVVTDAFDGAVVRPLRETDARSMYSVGSSTSIEFSVGGEARTPVAVASMTAKYVRERAMECFNAFWRSRQPGLTPTAGYPLDARRWRNDAAEAILASGIGEDRLWRRV